MVVTLVPENIRFTITRHARPFRETLSARRGNLRIIEADIDPFLTIHYN